MNVTLQTACIAVKICSALSYLHERGIVHRDIKPANIFLSTVTPRQKPNLVKLGDFGIVRWGDFKASVSTGSLTVMGQQGLGTMKYMSPEQSLEPKHVSVRSDMYSFGVTLYEMFTGQILPSHHHVSQITHARLRRSSIYEKLQELGLGGDAAVFIDMFGYILDMFLFGAQGRPSSKLMSGRLRFLLERLEERESQDAGEIE